MHPCDNIVCPTGIPRLGCCSSPSVGKAPTPQNSANMKLRCWKDCNVGTANSVGIVPPRLVCSGLGTCQMLPVQLVQGRVLQQEQPRCSLLQITPTLEPLPG